mgnify:CR=1 FL=1
MATYPPGTIAVIFISQRADADEDGYDAAANEMAELVQRQPGYLGVDSVREANGLGITVSYWADEASAIAWRDNEEHSAIRDRGRAGWYVHYDTVIARVTRSYDWTKVP